MCGGGRGVAISSRLELRIRNPDLFGASLGGFLSLPGIPAATTPSFRSVPGAGTGGAGRSEARSHARTPSPRLPLSSLPPLSTPKLRLPPPPEGTGLQRRPRRRKFGLVPSGAWELSGRLSLPRAQRRNCSCRSLLSPGATLLRQVLPSFPQGVCERDRPGPALPFRYQPVPSRRARQRSGQWPSGPALLSSPWQFSAEPRKALLSRRRGGDRHLPAAHSIPGLRQQARE